MDKERARLFIDEDVQAPLAPALRELGYDAVSAAECGRANQSISDEDQLAYATSENRILISYNVGDYYDLDRAWRDAGRAHCGIFVGQQRSSFQHLLASIREAVANVLTARGYLVEVASPSFGSGVERVVVAAGETAEVTVVIDRTTVSDSVVVTASGRAPTAHKLR